MNFRNQNQVVKIKLMKLIVGLGNPGEKFEKTRHNLGFWILDEFKKRQKFPKFKLQKKLFSLISEGEIFGEKIVLAKPQTFMNNSGKAVKLLIKNYQLSKAMAELSRYLIVVHDDLDIPLGKFKISFGKGSAGHKGVQSIIDELKTKDFVRLRIGIFPGKKPKEKDFVLKKFKEKERKILREIFQKIFEAIETIVKEGKEKAMQIFNQ